MAAAGQWGRASIKPTDLYEKLQVLKLYCEYVGYKLDEVHINADDIIDDANIGILKIANVGDIIDGVGLRVSDWEFYVVRKPQL
jgi:hypothetical protein